MNAGTDCLRMALKFRRRLAGLLLLRSVTLAAGLGAFGSGAAVCVARLWLPTLPTLPHWVPPVCAVAVFAIALVVCAVISWRRIPGVRPVLSLMDAQCRGGGLLVASADEDVSRWAGQMPVARPPVVRIHCAGELITLAAGVAFLALTALLPAAAGQIDAPGTLDITDEAGEIRDELNALEMSELLPDNKLKPFREALRQIEENAASADSARTYELLNVLEERIDQATRDAWNELADSAMSMENLAKVLEALQMAPPELAETAVAQLAELLSKLAASDPELASLLQQLTTNTPELQDTLENATSGKPLSPEELRNLAQFMRDNAEKIKQKLRNMAQKGCSGQSNAACEEQLAPMDIEALRKWLDSNCPGSGCLTALACPTPTPGMGSISRGRGDAPLELTSKTPDFDAVINEVGIDGRATNAETSVIRRTLSDPVNAEKDAAPAKAGALRTGDADIRARDNAIHPQHRRAVHDFFE